MSEELPIGDKKEKRPRLPAASKIGKRIIEVDLAEKSRMWQFRFANEIAAFAAIDPGLDATYATNWFAAIKALEAFASDEVMVDYITEKTADLLAFRKKVLLLANELEFYIQKAFPDDVRMPFEFGIVDLVYENNHAAFIINGFVTATIVHDYTTQLLAAGMPATFEALLQTALEDMAAAEIEQERQKRLRIRATTQRARLHNDLIAYWKRVSNAAAVRYYGTDAAAARFWTFAI